MFVLVPEKVPLVGDRLIFSLLFLCCRDNFQSKKGKTPYQLWLSLCELISKNPTEITSIRVEAIIRGGLKRFTDMVGSLWVSLADYHARAGNFDKVCADVRGQRGKQGYTLPVSSLWLM